ncbi:addiction module antidote protein, HigA family [Hanamia caeni]|jgi:addiction module HigA family antidote|uniref:Addiction module antidote protein, HigA family n=1 Tax=Hanamia caeni TaxID=2294116 RepID=A0A3M9N768_9BACT|nr:HigA family addiction module antitoxin [Hanamia caeni]RNI33621.1 addiction module antidote protein, HigA family [Hanamia caeni]
MMNEQLKVELELLTSPGDDIVEMLEHLEMPQLTFAQCIDVSLTEVQNIISGKEAITANTASKLEKVFGISSKYWLNREKNYRIKLLEINQKIDGTI